ncbi:MAG: CarD family transcriptional regulator [Treponemataceae bacterium]
MSNKITVYKIDQKVVYPSQGVGKILEIKDKKFLDKIVKYYVIYIEVSDMTVLIPCDKVDDFGIRPIVSAQEAEKALELIGEDFEPITSDWKLRYQTNFDLLKKGSVSDIATIVRSLYHRSKVKDLPIMERKLYDSAKKLLEDEISFALNKSVKEIVALIHSKLEPLGGISGTKVEVVSPFKEEDEDEEFEENDELAIEEDDDDDMDD